MTHYTDVAAELEGLMAGEPDRVARLANAAAAVFHGIPGLNWAGFYEYRTVGNMLVLGPFQGRPACTRILINPKGPRGVCATSAAFRRTVLVPDVHEFPGHIACDSASRSELVTPILNQEGELVAVLDLDSPELGRFLDEDRVGIETLADVIGRHWPD